ncbi:hypothetical protein OF83DRAFT_1172578 [Amylostereum chailletii]|nr:hypothetical protein OF83DRAFT_1172578 [Amylostereum chailletii]
MSGMRRVTTYTRRRSRDRAHKIAASSPFPDTDREEITLAEMSQRMKKRARQVARPQPRRTGSGDAEPILKRPRHAPSDALAHDLTSITLPSFHAPPADFWVSLNDGTNNLFFQTPHNTDTAATIMGSVVKPSTHPDRMSPVPSGRHIISRSASRNFKENTLLLSNLASPFHSRSASRAGSKTGSPKKKTPKSYTKKARTLSSAQDDLDNALSGPQVSSMFSVRAPVARRYLPSGPSDAYSLQDITAEDWLRPPKALARDFFSPDHIPPETPPPEWNISSVDTDTFLADAPRETSTPITKTKTKEKSKSKGKGRRAIDEVTPSAPNTPDVDDMTMASRGSPSLRRRTLVHRGQDSLFSGSFDDTMIMSLSHHRSKSNANEKVSTALGFEYLLSQSHPGSPAGNRATADDMAEDVFSVHSTSPMDDELSSLFDDMGLAEDRANAMMPNRSRSLDSAAPIVTASSQKEAGHRRNRAGTIRASDYMRAPTASDGPAPMSNTSAASAKGPVTTRTRSGTIRPARPPMTRISSEPCAPQAASKLFAGSKDGVANPVDDKDSPPAMHEDDPLDMLESLCAAIPSPPPEFVEIHASKRPMSRQVQTRVIAIDAMELMIPSDGSDDELLLQSGRDWNWDGKWD